MKRTLHIALVLLVALLTSSCGERGRVIPKRQMSELYAKMLLADQWIATNSNYYSEADTSVFYAQILDEMGWTRLDYVTSVNKYMDNPEDLKDIFERTKANLSSHVRVIWAEKRERMRRDSIKRAIDSMVFLRPEIMFGKELPDSVRKDTLEFYIDSNRLYKIRHFTPDTIYSGPAYHLAWRDTTVSELKQNDDE